MTIHATFPRDVEVVPAAGLEPATLGLRVPCSNQLSHAGQVLGSLLSQRPSPNGWHAQCASTRGSSF